MLRVEYINAESLGDELELAGIEVLEKSSDGFVLAVFEEEERVLYIVAIESNRKGFMKRKICELCERFETSTVEFVNVVNLELAKTLLKRDPNALLKVFKVNGERVYNIRVTWRCEK